MLSPMPAPLVRLLAIVVALAAGTALFAETRQYGLIGFDTYPLIVSSRVEAPSDLMGLLVEQLMDGRYPSPFYRPVTSASFALDEALWGLDAFGYQLTGALLFTGLLLLAAALGWRVGGSGARWLAIAIPAALALDPAHYEIVPVPARRADLLCCLFVTAAAVAALGGRRWAAGAASLLAILSKESGYVAPILVLSAGWWFATELSGRARLRHTARLAAPSVVFAVGALGGRFWLLGGVGGHPGGFGPAAVAALGPDLLLEVARGSALFHAAQTPLAWWVLFASLACATIASAGADPDEVGDAGLRRALGFGLTWWVAFAALYVISGWVGAWYFLLPGVGVAIVVSSGVGKLVSTFRAPQTAPLQRVAAFAAALGLCAVVLWQASFAPFFHAYGEWQRATGVAQAFLTELDRRIEAAGEGTVIDAPPLPMWAFPREGVPGVAGAAILSDYSVQAWAELVHPDRQIRVLGARGGILPRQPARAGADELVIRLPRRRAGY